MPLFRRLYTSQLVLELVLEFLNNGSESILSNYGGKHLLDDAYNMFHHPLCGVLG